MYSSRRCTNLTSAGLQTTPSQVSQYRAKNGNLRKSGSTFFHGTVFAPKQCLYQKQATGMESLKMYSFRQWKTSVTCAGLQTTPSHVSQYMGRERKFAEIRVYISQWYCVCTKAMFISKGSYGYRDSKNVFLSSVHKPHLPLRDCKRPRLR